MRLVIAILVVFFNLSNTPLYNAIVVVNDDAIEVGTIGCGKCVEIEVPNKDSCRVIFTLGKEREDWLGTQALAVNDTIIIDDATIVFDVDVELLED